MELERLFNLFLNALNRIDQSYFETVYENVIALHGVIGNRGGFRQDDFVRAGERIFCYELYHQFRVGVERTQDRDADFLPEALIQGEVQKWQVEEMVHHLGLQMLTNEFIPDLLVHSPGNAARQLLVVEVKSMPDVSRNQVWNDIEKLNQFVTSFRYERGIFLAVNVDHQRIQGFLENRPNNLGDLNGLDRIYVVTKSNANEVTVVERLNGEVGIQ